MSFDLYFCVGPGGALDRLRVVSELNGREFITESRSNDGSLIQFEYENPATSVYCLFDLSAEADQDENGLEIPESLVATGFSVSINFLRPSFFAWELMPVVSDVAASLGLSIYDPQSDRVHMVGTESDVLVGSWIEHNDKVTRGLAQEREPIQKPYLTREQSLYWWQYTRGRESYQNRLGDDIFVPSILFMVDPQAHVKPTVIWSAEVHRQALWSRRQPLPQIFPTCDYVMLAWGKSGAQPLEKAVVPYSTVAASMAALLEDIDGPVDGLKVLRPENQAKSSEIFDRLPKVGLGELKQVSSDGFQDVSPDGAGGTHAR